MANSDHLRILSSGVGEWNRWRENHPRIRPDLSGADRQGCPSIPRHQTCHGPVDKCRSSMALYSRKVFQGNIKKKPDRRGSSWETPSNGRAHRK